MQLARTLACAALTAAAVATPATAQGNEIGQDFLYTVGTSVQHTLLGQLDATCAFQPDRWTADYGPTHVTGTFVTTGPWAWVRCTIYSWDYEAGDSYFSGNGPVLTGTDYAGPVAARPRIKVCVNAGGTLAGTYVQAREVCRYP